MTYFCKLCDRTINLKSKHKLFKSKNLKYLEEFIIMRFIVANPIISQLKEIMKKYVNIYNKKLLISNLLCVKSKR